MTIFTIRIIMTIIMILTVTSDNGAIMTVIMVIVVPAFIPAVLVIGSIFIMRCLYLIL